MINSTSGNPMEETTGREGGSVTEVDWRSGKVSPGGDIWAETCKASQQRKSQGRSSLGRRWQKLAKSLSCQMACGGERGRSLVANAGCCIPYEELVDSQLVDSRWPQWNLYKNQGIFACFKSPKSWVAKLWWEPNLSKLLAKDLVSILSEWSSLDTCGL